MRKVGIRVLLSIPLGLALSAIYAQSFDVLNDQQAIMALVLLFIPSALAATTGPNK